MHKFWVLGLIAIVLPCAGCSTVNRLAGDMTTEEVESAVWDSQQRRMEKDGCPTNTYKCTVTGVHFAQETHNKFVGYIEVKAISDVRTEQLIRAFKVKGTTTMSVITKSDKKYLWQYDGQTVWKVIGEV
jgi:hypothetical protein